MNKTTRLLIIVVALAAFAALIFAKERQRAEQTPAKAASSAQARVEQSSPKPVAPSGLPRLVDLGSTTCIPCKMMAPILEDLRRDYTGRMKVEVIDVRQDRTAAQQYGIRVIPTQIFYDASGKERFRHEGFFAKEEILAKWQELGVDLKTH